MFAVVSLFAVSACTSGGAHWAAPGSGGSSSSVEVTPAKDAKDVPVSAEIALKAGKVKDVKLKGADGKEVPGELRPDGSSWVPASPLQYSTAYTAEVTSDAGGGGRTTFTTMARPGNRIEAHLYLGDNATYGQAMPIVVEFKNGGVAKANRAAVEKRLFVKSDPKQEGAWHWDSDIQVEYRPKDYWKPGTKLNVRLGLGGLPIGSKFGAVDITSTSSIDTVRRIIEVDNATKKLTAKQDDQVVQTYPVSLGKTAKPSLSGTMVIIERLDKTVFDSSTYGTPVDSADGYRTDIQFAERLTWDGQFIHAAPWSVDDQGKRNVSHGCVNVSLEAGQWIYNWTKVGDPVVVKGTEEHLGQGNGFTAWDLPWDQFKAGSAVNN